MKYPKQKEMHKFMGKPCLFDKELHKTYLRKKVLAVKFYSNVRPENVPVRWIPVQSKVRNGWIIGFGFCCNGTIVYDYEEGNYFSIEKRVNFVCVRSKPNGKEHKVPISGISFPLESDSDSK